MRNLRWFVSSIVLLTYLASQSFAADDPWSDFRYLIGEWVADSNGQPGQATGSFTLNLELQERVLVRRNKAELPATGGRPAASHEDLLIVYKPETGKSLKGIYFDNEDYVIDYNVSVSADKKTITLVSAAVQNKPRFRFSYTKLEDNKISTKFEIAPPGQPDNFKTYVEGVCKRKQ